MGDVIRQKTPDLREIPIAKVREPGIAFSDRAGISPPPYSQHGAENTLKSEEKICSAFTRNGEIGGG
jgi:hypothetical protein